MSTFEVQVFDGIRQSSPWFRDLDFADFQSSWPSICLASLHHQAQQIRATNKQDGPHEEYLI